MTEKILLADAAFLIQNMPDDVLSFTDSSTEIQGKTYPTYLKISRSSRSVLSFMLEKNSVAVGLAIVSNEKNENNVRKVVSLIYDPEEESTLLPAITRNLLDAVNEYETLKIFSENKPIVVVPVTDGESTSVALILKKPIFLTLSKKELTGDEKKLEVTVERKELIKAPIFSSKSLATLNIQLDGRILKSAPLYPVADIAEKKTLIDNVYRAFKQMVK